MAKARNGSAHEAALASIVDALCAAAAALCAAAAESGGPRWGGRMPDAPAGPAEERAGDPIRINPTR